MSEMEDHPGDWTSSAYMRTYVDAWARARPDLDIGALELVSWIGHVARILETRTFGIAAGLGLKAGELSLLLALRRQPNLQASPTALSRALWVTSGGMTYRIDQLVDRGLVNRLANPDDRRSFHIELTRAGCALADQMASIINSVEVEVAVGLDEDERQTLLRLLQKVHAGLDQAQPQKKEAASG